MIEVGNLSFEGEIFDTLTGRDFISKLPLELKTFKFGDCFYIKNEKMNTKLEKSSKEYFKDGDILFNPKEKEIFFGFGKITEKKDKMEQDHDDQEEEEEEEEKDDEMDKNYKGSSKKSSIIQERNIEENEEEENEGEDEEKKLNSKCNLFGKISTNIELISKIKPSSNLKIKLISHEQKKKRTIKLQETNETKKRKITKQSSVTNETKNISSTSSSISTILSIKYKYEGELDSDSKLIKTELSNEGENLQISSKDIKKYLIEDNVDFDDLNEIRYFEYSDDEDSEGWALLTDKFLIPIENRTRIKLKLRKGKLKQNENIFKRKTKEIDNYTILEDVPNEDVLFSK